MRTFVDTRQLPYTPEQIFDLVANVEDYPNFVPGWCAAKVRRRDGNNAYVEQQIGIGSFSASFDSEAVFQRPEQIRIVAMTGPFRCFEIRWSFEPLPGGGCRTRFQAGFELRPRLLEAAVGRLFADFTRRIVDSFERRALERYGR